MDIALSMFFFTLSNVEIDFIDPHIHQRTYIIVEVLSVMGQVELIGKKDFATAVFDLENEAFVIPVASISQDSDTHPSQRVQITLLKVNETSISLLLKYIDFVNLIFKYLAFELPKYIGITNNAIKPITEQQSTYELIYSLELIELETLKTYIKTILANGLIRLSKFSAGAIYLFIKKPDRSFQLFVNYRDFNNLTIKN